MDTNIMSQGKTIGARFFFYPTKKKKKERVDGYKHYVTRQNKSVNPKAANK
jgi:hypothetical protein